RAYVLAGHSYGGSLALRWALTHPGEVRGVLALATPAMDWGGSGIGAHYRIGGRAGIGDLLAQAAPVLAGPRFMADAMAEIFAPNPIAPGYLEGSGAELALRPATFRANAAMMLRLYPQVAAQCRRYGEIMCPMEVVHGEADTIVPAVIHAEPLASRVTRARLTLLPGIGHMPHHAEAGAVIDTIARLMQAAEGTYADHPSRRDPAEDPVHGSGRGDGPLPGDVDRP
ncbi:MAG: alpha/beta hydrolase, partial [Pseudomonadota bacterium]